MTDRGNWIHTHSGRRFYPLDPRPEDIAIEDIAHALSNICRFNGHCARFYSVAEHSLQVAFHVSWDKTYVATLGTTLAALLHDASEAYLCDIPLPLKTMQVMAPYRAMEASVEAAIAERFGLPHPMPAVVKRHDQMALATERRDLIPNALLSGWSTGLVEPWEDVPAGELAEDIVTPPEVASVFLAAFEFLSGEKTGLVSQSLVLEVASRFSFGP